MADYKTSRLSDYYQILWSIFLIVFIAIISYQIIKIIIGGSWAFEIAIMTIVIANLGISMKLSSEIGKIRTEIGGLKGEIGTVRGEIGSVRAEVGSVRGEIGNLRAEFYKNLAEFSAEIRKDIHNLDKRLARVEHKLKVS